MTLDANVAAAITEMKTNLWLATPEGRRKFPGSVELWCPVDSTSKTKIIVPGEIIYHLGITKDGMDAINNIFKGKKADGIGTTPLPAGHRSKGLRQLGKKASTELRARQIVIPLKTKYTYAYKNGTRDLKKISMRFPGYISIKGIIYFLWNHCDAAKRPSSFLTDNDVRYSIFDIGLDQLGELTDKVEEPDTNQLVDTASPASDKPVTGQKTKTATATP